MSNGDSNQGTDQGGGDAAQRGVRAFVRGIVQAIGNAVQGAHAPPGTPSVGTAPSTGPKLESEDRTPVTGAPADVRKTGP